MSKRSPEDVAKWLQEQLSQTPHFAFKDGSHICYIPHPDLGDLPPGLRQAAEAALYCIDTIRIALDLLTGMVRGQVRRQLPEPPAGSLGLTCDLVENLAILLDRMAGWMAEQFNHLQQRWLKARAVAFSVPGLARKVGNRATTAQGATLELTRFVCLALRKVVEGRSEIQSAVEAIAAIDPTDWVGEIITEARSAAMHAGRLIFDPQAHSVTLDGKPHRLDADAFTALKMMADSTGRPTPLTYGDIEAKLCLTQAKRMLKNRLPAELFDLIQAVRGKGVWLSLPLDPSEMTTL
jgi:hypothetical protein